MRILDVYLGNISTSCGTSAVQQYVQLAHSAGAKGGGYLMGGRAGGADSSNTAVRAPREAQPPCTLRGYIGSVARIRTVWALQVAARWARQEKIGKGAFGNVWRVVRVSGGEGPTEARDQRWNSEAI